MGSFGAHLPRELLELAFDDKSAFVRAWAAAHLKTQHYEPDLLADSAPIVRPALWSNPLCTQLPWSPKHWQERFQKLSQLERLGLMRNPHLHFDCVIALLERPSVEDLGVAREELVQVLMAAVCNPNMIDMSRRIGRKGWESLDDWHMPFKPFGRMWELCFEKWMDHPQVPYAFFSYIQTTPDVKFAIYKQLVDKAKTSDLREAIISSADPSLDADIFRAAMRDPEQCCRKRQSSEPVGLPVISG